MNKYYSPSIGGFVDPEILGAEFPADAIEINDDKYHELLSSQVGGGVAVGAIGGPAVIDPSATLDLAQLKVRKLAELAQAFADSIAALKVGYPADEIQSWFKQESEARAYVADNSASTPLLTAMAASRDISVADLAARVIANADAYSVAAGALIGKRQSLADMIDAATDATSVSAISWA